MPGQKMICQLVVTTIFVVYIWVMDSSCLELLIPLRTAMCCPASG